MPSSPGGLVVVHTRSESGVRERTVVVCDVWLQQEVVDPCLVTNPWSKATWLPQERSKMTNT